jgi:hypothetical protein
MQQPESAPGVVRRTGSMAEARPPMSSTNHNTLTTAEIEYLNQLEAWGASRSRGHQLTRAGGRTDPSSGERGAAGSAEAAESALLPARREAPETPLANVWERARQELGGDDVTAVDIRITVHKRTPPAELEAEPWPLVAPDAVKLLAQLRWLLSQSSGTIADVAHQLETRGADIDDAGSEQLRDDVAILDEELATVKALLLAPVDWDAEHGRLLAGEIPPFDDDADDEDEDRRE